jgi:hypothetical protein
LTITHIATGVIDVSPLRIKIGLDTIGFIDGGDIDRLTEVRPSGAFKMRRAG